MLPLSGLAQLLDEVVVSLLVLFVFEFEVFDLVIQHGKLLFKALYLENQLISVMGSYRFVKRIYSVSYHHLAGVVITHVVVHRNQVILSVVLGCFIV